MKKKEILRVIAFNIRKAREAANLTQEGLGELVGVHWKTIGYLEAGARDVGVSMVARVILALKVSPERIFSGIRTEEDDHSKVVRKATARKRRKKQ